MSISRPPSHRHGWAVLLLAWLVSIAAAEGVFRWLGDRPSDDLEGLFAPFGNGSYKLGSWVDTEAAWAAGRFSVHTDGLGLRCDAACRLAAKPDTRIDVLFLGDSQGFGHGVSYEESVAGTAAEVALRAGFRCANASVGGHGLMNQFELAQWLRDTQRIAVAHYVLLLTPLMIQDADNYNRATVGPDGRLYDRPPSPLVRLRLWLKTHSVVYGRIRNAALNAGLGGKLHDDASGVFELYGAGGSDEMVQRKLGGFLQRFEAFAARNAADVQLVYVPLTVEADSEALRRAAARRGLTIDCERPLRICTSAAARFGLRVHNLRPVLTQLHSGGDPLHLKGDFHYDRALSRECGLSIWNYLQPFVQSTADHQPPR